MKKKQELMREIVVPSHARVYLKTRKTCAQCGKIFEGTKKAIYCSVDCNRKANYTRHREVYLERQRTAYREHGRTDRASQAEKKTAGKK